MSAFAFFGILLCINLLSLQNALGQCAPGGLALEYAAGGVECGRLQGARRGRGYELALGGGYGWGAGEAGGAYGGAGTGDLDVAGELPVAGTTVVAGQVPVLGAVQFAGEVPAAGVVTIVGRCGCDCNGTPLF